MNLGWIYTTEDDKKRINTAIKLLDKDNEDTRDEIGIGRLRDAFSNILFPGTSVLQDRVKYFILVPYAFDKAIEKGNFKSRLEVKKYINKLEDDLVQYLVDNSGKNAYGIIGKTKGEVKYKPSAIFWSGLRISEILLNPKYSLNAAFDEVYKKTSKVTSSKNNLVKNSEDGADDDDEKFDSIGKPIFDQIKPKKDEFPQKQKISLTKEEAEYLYKHFTTAKRMKNSLFAEMLVNEEEAYFSINKNDNKITVEPKFKDFDNLKYKGKDKSIRKTIKYAKQLSNFVYGTRLLYYKIFAENTRNKGDATKIYSKLEEWLRDYKEPNINKIMEITQCGGSTKKFFVCLNEQYKKCNSKLKKMVNKSNKTIENELKIAEELIKEREERLKPGREKLKPTTKYKFEKKINDINGLNYRFNIGISHCKDILEGKNS